MAEVLKTQDNFEAKWSQALQEKHQVAQDKQRLEVQLGEAHQSLQDMAAKKGTLEQRVIELEAEFKFLRSELEDQTLKARKSTDNLVAAVVSPAGDSECNLQRQRELLAEAFEDLQSENRSLRQNLNLMVAKLAESQETAREVEDTRARLEHEIHRLNRLRGEAEMARSDAEKRARDSVHGSVLSFSGAKSKTWRQTRRQRKQPDMRLVGLCDTCVASS
jgi:DNA repair exonuclease SbcCD ATPase subunit